MLKLLTIARISHASKVMLKILQARLQQYVNRELPDVQADFRKGRGTRDQIANIQWMLEIWFLFPLPFLNTACTSGSSGSPTVEACLKDSEHYLANMRNECNCAVV